MNVIYAELALADLRRISKVSPRRSLRKLHGLKKDCTETPRLLTDFNYDDQLRSGDYPVLWDDR